MLYGHDHVNTNVSYKNILMYNQFNNGTKRGVNIVFDIAIIL